MNDFYQYQFVQDISQTSLGLPERNLFTAVLRRAILDSQERLDPYQREELIDWFLSEDEDTMCSFRWILRILGLEGSREKIISIVLGTDDLENNLRVRVLN